MTKLIEISWEVCNKVGGIHTVITSKLPSVKKKFNYLAVGPYLQSEAFMEEALPDNFLTGANLLKEKGVVLHYGIWKPYDVNVLLVDFSGHYPYLNGIKKKLWEKYKISSIRAGHDYDEPIVWSHAVGMVIEQIFSNSSEKVICQFHEWMSGAGLVYLKENKVNVKSVFTTHATILGRTLCSNGHDFYEELSKLNAEKSAERYGIEAKHGMEKTSAQLADVFTTVSELTGEEATYILGKKPDIITPNGLPLKGFPDWNEVSITRKKSRNKLQEFILMYFGAHYPLNVENTPIIFTSGRYEYRDKGLDVFVKALGKINSKGNEEMIVFFWIPAGTYSIAPELVTKRTAFHELKERVMLEKGDDSLATIKKVLENPSETLTPFVKRFKKDGCPPPNTHLLSTKEDPLLRDLYEAGLHNRKEDKVKVVFYPLYLQGNDGLLDLEYYTAIQGTDLGVFPSYYEPWGYTPLEAAAFFIPSITTNLAGFGRYVQGKGEGALVLQRKGKSDDSVSEELSLAIKDMIHKGDDLRRKAREIAKLADWENLFSEYEKAYK